MSSKSGHCRTGADSAGLAEVAHELRSPLGGIEAMVDLLGQTALTPEQARLLLGLKAAAAHLRSVASDIIDQAKDGIRPHGFDEEPLDLRSFLDAVNVSAGARARAKGLDFTSEVDSNMPARLVCDAKRLRQMLENFIDNAVKVTCDGSVRLTVRHVDTRGAFAGLMFSVTDTGPGLSEQEQEKLFRMFSRVDNGVAGSGVGLAMVRRFAQAMGGEVGCNSKSGEGATFWFSLRLRIAEEHANGEPATQASPSQSSEGVLNDLPILVVDDNPANRMIMSAILEHFQYRVVEADSGEAALALVQSQPFGAVMLDQTLPGLSGVETLTAIRALTGPERLVPVIPVTGRVSQQDKAAFAAAGAHGFVEKPVTAKAIRDSLLLSSVPETRKQSAA